MSAPAGNIGEGSGRAEQQGKSTAITNARERRAVAALLTCQQSREQLDRAAGCSNSPDLVARLRRRGLTIPCEMVQAIDRDGAEIRRGIYRLTDDDRGALQGITAP